MAWRYSQRDYCSGFHPPGIFIAWLTLTGPSKDIVGIAILGSITLWLLTIGLRKEKKTKPVKETGDTVLGRKRKDNESLDRPTSLYR